MINANAASAEKGIAIGIVGPQPLVEKIAKVIKTFPSFRPIVRLYQEEEEAPQLVQEILADIEVLLLSGPYTLRKVKEKVTTDIPIHYVQLTGTGLYRALFRIEHFYGLEKSLSVDTLTRQMVERTFAEIGDLHPAAICYDGPVFPSEMQLVSFHKGQYEAGYCSAAVTGVHSVSSILTKLGIPNELIVPTEQDIIVALERALLSTETRRSKEAQIVVGLINVDHFARLIQQHDSEHEVQKFKLDIYRMLLDYVESLNGYLTHLGGDEYLFFTTRGSFERETAGYKSIPLALEANKTLGITLSIGIGFGRSANEAGTHARIALRRSKEVGGNTCFIVREDRTLIGPLQMAEPVEYDLSFTDAEMLKKAEEAGMTSAYLSKMMANAARFGKIDYKVHELASVLGITVRSTHRLLLHWIDAGLVEIAGMEKVPKGRPRQIFRLAFLDSYISHH